MLRHCESIYNINSNNNELDCTLSKKGYKDANNIHGTYDLVICSPMLRCLLTFAHSNIVCKKIIINKLCREFKQNNCDFMIGENKKYELECELIDRVKLFKQYLKQYENKNINILVIGHADFIYCFTSYKYNNIEFGKWLKNGEIIEILDLN